MYHIGCHLREPLMTGLVAVSSRAPLDTTTAEALHVDLSGEIRRDTLLLPSVHHMVIKSVLDVSS